MLAPGATRARAGGPPAGARGARPAGGPASSATVTGSCTPPPSGAWPARPRSFVFPADHQRTRRSHALEVAQVATGIARALRLNVALTEAIALGHDCGHGPGGHMSEDALGVFLPGGFDHAVWGADVVARQSSTCATRPSTASATTRGRVRRREHPRGRGGELGRPHRRTCATTGRTPCRPAS